ncbi:autotransporter outer membrane beta-barrel domain-containing protein [Enterobacter roggenkampii]|uniref:autotransporter outer membrane beta-barrel domain-containing protein n=1 Tax=Enterobacter roggenkampii TaxID=1812935 RepID=UPI002FFC13BA
MKKKKAISGTMMRKYLFGALTLSLSLFANPAFAGVVSGEGSSQTIKQGDPAERWQVSDKGLLILNNGAQAESIVVRTNGKVISNNASISENNGAVGSPGIWLLTSSGEINNTRITVKGGRALQLGDGSVADVNGGYFEGDLGAISLQDPGTVLNITGAEIRGHLGIPPYNTESFGQGIQHYGGTLTVTESRVTGDTSGIQMLYDGFAGEAAVRGNMNMTLNDTSVTGLDGSAIRVSSYEDTPTWAVINITGNSVLSGSNGTLLEVSDQSIAELNISGSQLTGNIVNEVGSTTGVTLTDGASLTGQLTNVTSFSAANGTTWQLTGDSIVGNISNSGTITLGQNSAGTTLRVTGNYAGQDGLLVFNGELAGDDSLTDRLIIDGSTSGNTFVSVRNLGGSGAQTLNGIELITVGGNSAGTFKESGRIVAGAYDYHLMRGTGSNAGNWYLSSEYNDGGDGGDGGISPVTLILRPEAGVWTSSNTISNTLFLTSLRDRESYKGDQGRMWSYARGTHLRQQSGSDQLKSDSNTWVTQIGADLGRWKTGNNGSFRAGVMAGSGRASINSRSILSGYTAKGNLTGWNLGVYGTWYQNEENRTGFYADTWMQYSWFNGTIRGQGQSGERYHSDGLSASIEAGYSLPFLQTSAGNFILQPRVQFIQSDVRMNDHQEVNGTKLTGSGNSNLQSRTGAKVSFTSAAGKSTAISTWVSADWIHNTQQYGVRMDDVLVESEGSRDMVGIAAGIDGRISEALSISANVTQSSGTGRYSETSGQIGISWAF